MYWDIFLLKMDKPIPFKQLENDLDLPSLGSMNDVISVLSEKFPGIDWNNPALGNYKTEYYSIDFSLGDKEVIDSVLLYIKGEYFPKKEILALCRPMGWQAIDIDKGEYL
jgi:hypothetical protein